jgi:hypothetical protein
MVNQGKQWCDLVNCWLAWMIYERFVETRKFYNEFGDTSGSVRGGGKPDIMST